MENNILISYKRDPILLIMQKRDPKLICHTKGKGRGCYVFGHTKRDSMLRKPLVNMSGKREPHVIVIQKGTPC